MDSFTQIVLGIATAELCAGEKLHRKTILYGAVLGTIPDLDVVFGQFLNPVNGVAIHRGLSHSLLFFGLLSPILGWAIAKIERGKINFRTASLMVFWCLFTHVLLDMFTSWGTQIFWPFPDRIALKTIFVIDPLYTLPLLVYLILAWRKPTFLQRKKYVLRGIYISSLYLLLTCGLKLYALQQFKNALQEQHITYNDLIVKPTAFNCILWNANVATKDAYLLGDYSLFDSQPITFERYEKNNSLSQQLAGNPDFETLKKVSEGWYIITKKDNEYHFNDLRFGLLTKDPKQPQFAFSYVFKEENGKLRAQEVPKEKRDGKALMKGILNRIKGN
ncbi:metal-dependent hydrolase [Flavobacterium branchiarum]|uniref:Metal-dependent hydrolase n=1 Tax=Flavobacterium branchiarum TaxID=1114870 RepID=A0ABV5FQE3_9FLAO|nr:metal-dependent hydrolase [Flavobacterium branchiarum]MDN3672932.1 metal-dependent hydrolase [Flavobacterium branchiarum]